MNDKPTLGVITGSVPNIAAIAEQKKLAERQSIIMETVGKAIGASLAPNGFIMLAFDPNSEKEDIPMHWISNAPREISIKIMKAFIAKSEQEEIEGKG